MKALTRRRSNASPKDLGYLALQTDLTLCHTGILHAREKLFEKASSIVEPATVPIPILKGRV